MQVYAQRETSPSYMEVVLQLHCSGLHQVSTGGQ